MTTQTPDPDDDFCTDGVIIWAVVCGCVAILLLAAALLWPKDGQAADMVILNAQTGDVIVRCKLPGFPIHLPARVAVCDPNDRIFLSGFEASL